MMKGLRLSGPNSGATGMPGSSLNGSTAVVYSRAQASHDRADPIAGGSHQVGEGAVEIDQMLGDHPSPFDRGGSDGLEDAQASGPRSCWHSEPSWASL